MGLWPSQPVAEKLPGSKDGKIESSKIHNFSMVSTTTAQSQALASNINKFHTQLTTCSSLKHVVDEFMLLPGFNQCRPLSLILVQNSKLSNKNVSF